jgi:hypothetical protein
VPRSSGPPMAGGPERYPSMPRNSSPREAVLAMYAGECRS